MMSYLSRYIRPHKQEVIIEGQPVQKQKASSLQGNSLAPEQVTLMLEELKKLLGINRTQLAAIIGTTEHTLFIWQTQIRSSISEKLLRLQRLYDVVNYILSKNSRLTSTYLLDLLQQGYITLDPSSADDSTISLLGYVKNYPTDIGWKANVDVAQKDFERYFPIKRVS